jgi:probable F420-dependent oxidoreductase
MNIGFFAIGIGNLAQPKLLTAAAENGERLQFSTIWAPEHLLFPQRFDSKYPYARGEDLPISTDIPFLNPFLALTYAAARTQRIRLATGICLVPEYHPILLAKICASLDCLSEGRLALGIGIGWLREEFEVLGIPWERRAKRTREYVEAMRRLWNGEHSYQGEFANFAGVMSFPTPTHRGKLPILVGGQSEAALKRAAAYGNGWCGFNLTPEETGDAIKKIKNMLAANGRDREPFEYSVSPIASATPDDLKRYHELGIHELNLAPVFRHSLSNETEVVKVLEDLARNWVEPASRL